MDDDLKKALNELTAALLVNTVFAARQQQDTLEQNTDRDLATVKTVLDMWLQKRCE